MPTNNGLWQGNVGRLSLHGVELREAYKSGLSEHLLYVFCKKFLKDAGGEKPVDEEDLAMYRLLGQQVAQFRRNNSTMHLRDIDIAQKRFHEEMKKCVQELPIEERLEGLTLEQVLGCYTPEQLLAALPPELARKLRG